MITPPVPHHCFVHYGVVSESPLGGDHHNPTVLVVVQQLPQSVRGYHIVHFVFPLSLLPMKSISHQDILPIMKSRYYQSAIMVTNVKQQQRPSNILVLRMDSKQPLQNLYNIRPIPAPPLPRRYHPTTTTVILLLVRYPIVLP